MTASDVKARRDEAAYSEKYTNHDEGFSVADVKNNKTARAQAIFKIIQARLNKAQKDRPFGYLVREVPADDLKGLNQLSGHLQAGLFITKFRKIFSRDEMNDDLVMLPARHNEQDDNSEYEEILPTSPP